MVITAFSYQSRNFRKGGILYLFPGRHNVSSALLRDYLDNLDTAYRIFTLRFNNTTNVPIYLKDVQFLS